MMLCLEINMIQDFSEEDRAAYNIFSFISMFMLFRPICLMFVIFEMVSIDFKNRYALQFTVVQ